MPDDDEDARREKDSRGERRMRERTGGDEEADR